MKRILRLPAAVRTARGAAPPGAVRVSPSAGAILFVVALAGAVAACAPEEPPERPEAPGSAAADRAQAPSSAAASRSGVEGAALSDAEAAAAVGRIEAVLAEQADAWNRGDLEGFMEGYLRSPDLSYTAGGAVHRGWDQLLDRYRRAYGEGAAMGRLTFDDLEVHPLSPDAAWALGRWRLELAADTLGGAYTLVLREVDGEWKVVHDHTSTDAPPAPAEAEGGS
jgi:uncharacterized protein (TIGR02246 family)